jgi:hypothetical protein
MIPPGFVRTAAGIDPHCGCFIQSIDPGEAAPGILDGPNPDQCPPLPIKCVPLVVRRALSLFILLSFVPMRAQSKPHPFEIAWDVLACTFVWCYKSGKDAATLTSVSNNQC